MKTPSLGSSSHAPTWQIEVSIGIVLVMLLYGIVTQVHALLSRGQVEMLGAEA